MVDEVVLCVDILKTVKHPEIQCLEILKTVLPLKLAMGLPRLQTCCFVLDLKTGNIVMGCFNAFLSFTMFVVMIVESVSAGTERSEDQKVAEEIPDIANIELEAQMAGLYAMSVILVIMYLAKLIFDLIFVFGVMTERRAIIKAYFIMWIVFFLLSVFTFSVHVLEYGTGTICMTLTYIGINVYCILLSYSFYKQINEREEV